MLRITFLTSRVFFQNFNPLSEEESAKENIENFFKGASADLDQVRPLSAHMKLSYLNLLSAADLCGSDAI